MNFFVHNTRIRGDILVVLFTPSSGERVEYLFETLKDAVKGLGPKKIRADSDNPYLLHASDYFGHVWDCKAWFYCGQGRLIAPAKVLEVADQFIRSRPLSKFARFNLARKQSEALFRVAPVVGTGKGSYYHCWRYPNTFQEIRENRAVQQDIELSELGVRIRGRRTKSALPTVWDDAVRGDHKHFSWKRHRKHQWK